MTREPTERQWQVAALMADGLDQAAVAARLAISRHTLRNHLYGNIGHLGLYERIGAGNDTQAVIWFYRHGVHQCPLGLRPAARE